jgi:hypothetical protein
MLALLKTVKSTVNADKRTSIVGNKYTNCCSEIRIDTSATWCASYVISLLSSIPARTTFMESSDN